MKILFFLFEKKEDRGRRDIGRETQSPARDNIERLEPKSSCIDWYVDAVPLNSDRRSLLEGKPSESTISSNIDIIQQNDSGVKA